MAPYQPDRLALEALIQEVDAMKDDVSHYVAFIAERKIRIQSLLSGQQFSEN